MVGGSWQTRSSINRRFERDLPSRLLIVRVKLAEVASSANQSIFKCRESSKLRDQFQMSKADTSTLLGSVPMMFCSFKEDVEVVILSAPSSGQPSRRNGAKEIPRKRNELGPPVIVLRGLKVKSRNHNTLKPIIDLSACWGALPQCSSMASSFISCCIYNAI